MRRTRFRISTNTKDPLILRADRKDDVQIELFGKKAADGTPTILDSLRITDPAGGVTRTRLDGASRTATTVSDDGHLFSVSWRENGIVVVSAVTPDGSVQINQSFDLTYPIEQPPSVAAVEDPASIQAIQSKRPRGAFRPSDIPDAAAKLESNASPAAAAAIDGTSQIAIRVDRCGAPVGDAFVEISATQEGDPIQSVSIPASPSGDGRYLASIPTASSSVATAIGDVCSVIAPVVDATCTWAAPALNPAIVTPICTSIAAAASATLTPAGGLALLGACETSLVGFDLTCSTLGYDGGLIGANNVLATICSSLPDQIERQLVGDTRLVIAAKRLDELASTAITAPANGPFPDVSLQLPGAPEITSLTTSPIDPAPFQSYVAEASVVCVRPATRVGMSIVGTDGYSDSKSCAISGTGTCTLNVPGAEQDVLDTIETTIENGPSRTTYLVF